MRYPLLVLMVSITFGSAICPAQAQTQAQDVVYLKNGSIIKGNIMEIIPNKSVKIQTADGSIYAYSISEVEKITDGPNVKGVKLFAGSSIPIGEFGKNYTGFGSGIAKTGYVLGVDVSKNLSPNIAWISSATLSVNRPQSPNLKNWVLGWLLTGWEVRGNAFPKVEVLGFGQLGVLFTRIPGQWCYTDSLQISHQIHEYTFGLGVGAGISIGPASIILRCLNGYPEFDLNRSTNYTTAMLKQPISCLMITGGYTF